MCRLAATLAVIVALLLSVGAAWANKDAVAVIIGNKDYAGSVPDVDFAHNDAEAMKRFVVEVLGFREGNIIDLSNATKGNLESVFGTAEYAKGQLHDWVREGLSDVVVFYSGHGAPGLRDKRGYLVPVDADPNRMELNGYPVDLLYANLARIPARSILVFLDTCFSGETSKGIIVDSYSAIRVIPKTPQGASNFTVLTAASGEQVANWDNEAKHGLFTRYLLEGLRGAADGDEYGNGDGQVTLAEVKEYLKEMTYQSRRRFGTAREQRATAIGDDASVLASLPAKPPPPPGKFTVADADLTLLALKQANVRSGPSAEEEMIGALRKGTEVNVTGEVEGLDWYRIALADGGEGYVWRPLLGEEQTPTVEAEPELSPPLADSSEIMIASFLPCDAEVEVNTHKSWDYTGVVTNIRIAFKNDSDEEIDTVSFEVIDNNGMVITVALGNTNLKPGEGKVLKIQQQYTQFIKPSNLWEEKMRSEENKYKNIAGCRSIGVTYED